MGVSADLANLYEDAVTGGDSQMANYYAKMIASQAGININTNAVTAAPASAFGPSVSFDLGDTLAGSSGTPKVIDSATPGSRGLASLLNGVIHPLDTIKGIFDPAQAAANAGMDNGTGLGIDKGKAAIAFVTDIPRVATTLLGLILIIAGIFALSKGPAVNIVTSAVRGAVTS